MTTKTWLLAGLAVTLVLALSGQKADAQGLVTQPPSLMFDVVKLTLGMSESAVRQALKDYTLAVSPANLIGVRTKSTPSRPIGILEFNNGRLMWASVAWLVAGQEERGL